MFVGLYKLPQVRLRMSGIGLLLMFLSSVMSAMKAHGDSEADEQLQQKKVKAVFVLNVAKFVRWPEAVVETRSERLTLCYDQEDVLGSAYEIIRNHSVNGRLLARQWINSSQDLETCDVLLLSKAGLERYRRAPLVSPETPLLVIADLTSQKSTGKAYPGVHVALVRKGSKIGFDINLHAAHQAGLKLSSRLLRLARIVGEET